MGASCTNTMKHGACEANLFIPMDVRASATSAQSSGLSTTMKCHGWELHADGARRAASTMRITASRGTLRSVS